MSEPLPPIETRFALGPITDVHHRFLDHYGFLHFDGALDGDEVVQVKGELARIAAQWIETGRKKVNGIPIFYGQRSDGRPFVQRFAFASMFSKTLSHLVKDKRFTPLLALMEPGARIGESEKDGVVVNRYINEKGSIYKRLGWHTDGLRDLFYFRMPDKMLNVGLHLDDVNAADGGLRLIPGSHRQGLFSMCFRKLYFLWHRRDPQEICVETRAGDLTVHDGRLWHRVAQSQKTGVESLRHSIYVPYVTGPVEPKHKASPTPGYHRLGMWMRAAKQLVGALALAVAFVNPVQATESLNLGSLEGTFALKLANADWVSLPAAGRRVNRGVSWYLIKRDWRPTEGLYRQRSRICRVHNDAVMGTKVELGTRAIRTLPPSEEWVSVDPTTGRYRMEGHVQLWGIRNLPDRENSPLPNNPREASASPYIYDMDGDGLPGVTMIGRGFAHGELQGIQRKQVWLTGHVLSRDRVVGTSEVYKETLILKSSNPLTSHDTLQRSEAVVDQSENWFEELRLPEQATCTDVMALEDSFLSNAAPGGRATLVAAPTRTPQ